MPGASASSVPCSCAGKALVVERVAALVQRREHGGQRRILEDADGQAHVTLAGHQRERMRGAVEAPAL